MKNRILLIGTLKSSYITQYIENVLEPLGFDIYMQVSKSDIEYSKSFIEEHNIHFIKFYENGELFYFKIPFIGNKIKSVKNLFSLIKSKPYNYIHIQFVTNHELLRAKIASSRKTKCYASFWGSDLLRQTKKYLKKEEKYLRNYELISADGYTLQNAYKNIYPKLNVKFEMIPYGVSLIQYIDKYSKDVGSCKSYFGFPKNKKIVAIGYNAIKQQQHDKVMDALIKIENKEKYFLVFQMSYGFNDDKNYIPNLVKIIDNSGFEYKIIKDFLSMEDLAKFRIATDVFINAQTTDAFANSFIENVYAKSIMINAKWLHYPELDEFPLYVNEFSVFNEIPSLLEKKIDNDKLEWNKKCVENRTWEECCKKWAEAYSVDNINKTRELL